jgi:peroxiredoxin
MKTITVLLLLLGVIFSTNAQIKFKVECSVINTDSLKEANVFAFGDVKFTNTQIKIEGSKFIIEGEAKHPCLAVINTDKVRGGLGLWLSNGNYSATFYVKKHSSELFLLQPFSVNGSTESNNYLQFINLKNDLVDIQSDRLKRNVLKCQFLEEFISEQKNSYLSLHFLKSEIKDCGTQKIKELFNTLTEELQNSENGKRLVSEIEKVEQNSIGTKISDFTLTDINGVNINASSTIKSYTIISFWASWCAPCRTENQILNNHLSLFKDKSIQLIGISLDENKNDWENAVRKDKLNWLQLSDLKGFENDISKKFKITSIPYLIMVDKDMKIVASDYSNIMKIIQDL